MRPCPVGTRRSLSEGIASLGGELSIGGTWVVLQTAAASPATLSYYSHGYK